MKKTAMRWIVSLCGLTLILVFSTCCSLNKLQGVEFRERTASAFLAYPPPPEVFTDGWANIDFDNPIRAAIGIGTGIAKEVEAGKTRAKMDSAMGMVDIPEIVRVETLERGSKHLHYRPVEEKDDSDFRFNIVIKEYGIDAGSWTAGVYFKMNVEVALLDNKKTREVWRSCFNEKVAVSREFFGLPGAVDNILTMVSLSNLTSAQIADGLENLAVHTSDRMMQKLQRDFSGKNQ
jgi:hypothetical protein